MSRQANDRKQLHTLPEYVRMGYPESILRRVSHMPNSPFWRFTANGTFYAEKNVLDDYLRQKSEELR